MHFDSILINHKITLWCCYEKDIFASTLLKGQGETPPLSGVPVYLYQQSLSTCIDVCVQQAHAANRQIS